MKKRCTLLFMLALIGLSSTFAQIPTTGLVGNWPFSGNANDISGNNLNGTVNNATLTTDRFGNLNSAYAFNGTNSQITVTDNSLIDLTGDFTISSWFYLNQYGHTWSTILSKHNQVPGEGTYSYGIDSVGISDHELAFQADPNFNTSADCGISGNVQINQWYNFVVSYDTATSNLKYYLDGNLISTVNVLFNIQNTSYNMLIGHEAGALDLTRWFNGKIDDILIYNRVLSDNEINSIFNSGLCYQTITVTDTLIINANLTGFNPIAWQNTIKIFPNPTNDQITIDFGSNYTTMNGYTLKITNSLSQIVYTTPINQQTTTVNLSTWTGNGIYFVHLIDAQSNTIDIRKIVLQ